MYGKNEFMKALEELIKEGAILEEGKCVRLSDRGSMRAVQLFNDLDESDGVLLMIYIMSWYDEWKLDELAGGQVPACPVVEQLN